MALLKITNSFQPVTNFVKTFILDVWQGSEYAYFRSRNFREQKLLQILRIMTKFVKVYDAKSLPKPIRESLRLQNFSNFFFFFSQAFSPKKLSLFWKCFSFWKDKVEDNFTILFSFLVLCFFKVKKIFMKVYARKKKLFWPICESLCSQNANISQIFLSRESFFF